MKRICEYREFDNISTLPSVKDNIVKLPSRQKLKVLSHLKKGNPNFASTVLVSDVFRKKSVPIEMETFTDGEYVWTSEEMYHFDKYDIKLNDDFISKILL